MAKTQDFRDFAKKYWFYFVLLLYTFTRTFKLSALPIFNDESIYIDWGNKIRLGLVPFSYSLYDGKPPLHFVLLSVFRRIISEPLISGRLLSVVAGGFSLYAVKKITELFLNKEAAIVSTVLYTISPMYLFYDRQALQESLLICLILWGLYYYFLYFKSYKNMYFILSAFILALAFMVKVSMLVVFVPMFIYFTYKLVTQKNKQNDLYLALISFIVIFSLTLIPLLKEKSFFQIFSRNNRYAITLSDINSNIYKTWSYNTFKTIKVLLWYFNVVFVYVLWILTTKYKKVNKKHVFMLFLILLPLFLIIISSRGLVDRYLVPFSTPFIFMGSYTTYLILKKYGSTSLFLILIPIFISLYQIIKIDSYLRAANLYAKGLDLYTYTDGFTAGYGVKEAIEYIKNDSRNDKKVFIGVRLDAGNPESAIMAYFLEGDKARIIPLYFDAQITKIPLDRGFIGNYYPFYFVSRDDNLGGMNQYLTEIKRFVKPDGKTSIGIYKYKNIITKE